MRIGLFAPYDLARSGGVTSHIRAQARALRSLGLDVTVLGPASAPLEDGEVALGGAMAITVGGTTSGVALDPRIAARVRRVFASRSFDVVHVHEPLMPLAAWCAVWWANAPVVGTFHVHREDGHRFYPIARPLLQRIASRVSARIAVSEAAKQTVEPFFPGHYDVIPNGIELARFQTVRPRPAIMPEADATVLCVGRLEPRKGVATLVEAMGAVSRRIPHASLVVVGDGPERAALAAAADRLGVRITFARRVSDADLPAFYQAADVVCAPALGGESFGIVLFEALATGKPVVASRLDGYVAAAGESSCVRFVAPGDAAALASQIVELLIDRRMTWRAEAVRIASVYDWRRVAERITAVYRRVQRVPDEATAALHS